MGGGLDVRRRRLERLAPRVGPRGPRGHRHLPRHRTGRGGFATVVVARAPQLLYAVRIPERIERVLARPAARRDVCDHDRVRVAHERVPEHLSELGPPEGDVALPQVERPDALLESEQRLVDLRTLQPRLPVVVVRVRAPLAPRQVDERELPPEPPPTRPLLARPGGRAHPHGDGLWRFLKRQHDDPVGARRVRVGARAPRRPRPRAVLDELADDVGVIHLVLLQPHDHNITLGVLPQAQLPPAVEQVEHLAPVDLEVGDPEG
mmetsp:Transcript_4238/g.13490  ORF Transcript_4238/g.13490 Transcript_4238/m.13490 type:complete len:263 (+) Transcript_4238:877-1665(+)